MEFYPRKNTGRFSYSHIHLTVPIFKKACPSFLQQNCTSKQFGTLFTNFIIYFLLLFLIIEIRHHQSQNAPNQVQNINQSLGCSTCRWLLTRRLIDHFQSPAVTHVHFEFTFFSFTIINHKVN